MPVQHQEAGIGFDFGISEVTAVAALADTAAAASTAAAATTAAATTAAASTAALSVGEASLLASAGAAAAAPIAAGTAAAAGGGLLSASTLAQVGIGTSLVSAGVGALGSIHTAEAQKKAADYQAQVDLNNQKLSSYYADTEAAKGASELSQQGQKAKQQMDLIRASQAASGVDVASGSSEDVRNSQEILNNLDALTIMSNTAQKVYGYEVGGVNAGNAAGLQRLSASQAPAEAALGASASVLSGVSGAANQYLGWQRVAGGPSASLFG